MITVLQTPNFRKQFKKLKRNEQEKVIEAVREIQQNPEIGDLKIQDLKGVRCYKFQMVSYRALLAYLWEDGLLTLTLLAVCPHENFYRDLKTNIN